MEKKQGPWGEKWATDGPQWDQVESGKPTGKEHLEEDTKKLSELL